MGLLSTDNKTTTDQSSSSSTNFNPGSEQQQKDWGQAIGGAGGQRDWYLNNPPPTQARPEATPLSENYYKNAANQPAFDTEYYRQPMRETYGETTGMRMDPNGVNFKQDYNFTPGAINDPYANGIPKVGPGGGLGATAGDYQIPWERVNAQQIAAERISAPGGVDRISGLERVYAPQLQQYQMGPADQVSAQQVRDFQMGPYERVNAPQLQQYSMQAAANIAPGGQATTKSWTDPGVAQQYMNPYQQQVTDVQKKRALEDWQTQNQMLGAEAAKAGAFGGSRHGVREATAARDMEDQMAMLQATGLQQAYERGMGTFGQEQQLSQAAQQFNLGQGMQASLANQAAQQQAAQANLQSYLQTQGLGAQLGMQGQLANQAAGLQVGQTNLGALMQAEALRTGYGMQAGLANQAANLQVGQANLGANLQTQGLGANLGMQAALANQGQTLQQKLANQAASQFESDQIMRANMANQQYGFEASRANQGANLQGQLANQQTGYQAGLAGTQMGFQGAMFNAQQGMEAMRANQQAGMQMLGDQYRGGMQTQQLGMQGQIQSGQMNQNAQFQQEQAGQNRMGLNLNALNMQSGMANNMANLGLAGYGMDLSRIGMQGNAANNQQALAERGQAIDYANALNTYQNPMRIMDWYTSMLGRQPMPYQQNTTGTQRGTSTTPGPGWLQQGIGAAFGAAGSFLNKGGRVPAYAEGGRFRSAGPPKQFGRPARFADGGLGDVGLGTGDETSFNEADELLYTTPEGLPVYGPKKQPAAPAPQAPDWRQRLKDRYAQLQSKIGQPKELGFASYLYPEKRTGPPSGGGLGEFADVASMMPIIGMPVAMGTKAFGKGLGLVERAAETGLGRKLTSALALRDLRKGIDAAQKMWRADETGRVLQLEAPELIQRKPLMVPQAEPRPTPQILDQFGRPAQPEGGLGATEEAPGLLDRARQWLGGGKKPSPRTQAKMDARGAELERMGVREHLLPQEEKSLLHSDQTLDAFKTLSRELPSAYRMESMALLGSPKKGWYKGSSQAIVDIFHNPDFEKDPIRFAQTLAAMSPQTSVENNLINTLNVWKNWTAAGRPTDPKQIKAIMGASVMGDKGEKSVLHAWFPNVVRSLTAADPDLVTLSGPKVDSFFRNLLSSVREDYANRLTNDTWIANIGGHPQDWFGRKPTAKQLAAGNPGFTPGYTASSVAQRQAAKNLGWKPMEVQETGWSAGKFLYEEAERQSALQGRQVTPMEILESGRVTPEALRGTPDFASLMPTGLNRQILEEAGYGDKLANLRPSPVSSAMPMTLGHQREAMNVAETLHKLQGQRGLGEQFTKGIFQPKAKKGKLPSVPVGGLGDLVGTEMAEAVPGAGIGHLPGMPMADWKKKVKYTQGALGAFEAPKGEDAIWKALNVDSLSPEKNIGAWRPKGLPPEVNPQYTIGVKVPMMGGRKGEIYPSWLDKANAGLALRGLLTGQKGQAMNILRQSENQQSGLAAQMMLNRAKGAPKFTGKTMKKVMKPFPHMDFGHTGPHLNVFDFATDAGLSDAELNQIQKLVGAKKWVRADSLGPYVDFTDEWAKQPGSGEATGKMFSFVKKLDPRDYASLDQAIRVPAGKLYDFMRKQRGAKREDLMNLLQIIREQGLVGAEKAWKSGAFLPGVVGAMIAPSMLSHTDEETLQ